MESRIYECVFLASSSISEDGMTNLVNNFRSIFTENDIKVERHENWGLLNLAYSIKDQPKANFFMFIINGTPESVQKFKNKLKYNELILRYMMLKKRRQDLVLASEGISLKIPQQQETKAAETDQTETEDQEKALETIEYKSNLRPFVTGSGRVYSKKYTGLSSKLQRKAARSIKQAKFLALLPYCDRHKK